MEVGLGKKVSDRTNTYGLFGITTKMLCCAMNYQELSNLLEHNLSTSEKDKLFQHYYYSNRSYVDSSIRLHREHTAINPKVCINTQTDYEYYLGTLLYLREQLYKGVNPKWLITFHYQHPVEHIKSMKETDKPFGFGDRYGFKTYGSLWNQVANYNYWENKRNEEDNVIKDAAQIRNIVLKLLYGIKRLNQSWKYKYPNLLFFHEKGKTKLQYHTHLLLPATTSYNNLEDLTDVFNSTIRKSRKCFSKWKRIDIRKINYEDKYEVIGYLNKETNSSHLSFDPYNSIIPVLT